MTQVVACPSCAKKLKAPTEALGKRVTCPGCKTPFVIPQTTVSAQLSGPAMQATTAASSPVNPAAAGTTANSANATRLLPVACPQCAKQLKAPPEMAGKSVNCPGCKAPFTIPGLVKGQASPTRAAKSTTDGRQSFADEVAAAVSSGAVKPTRSIAATVQSPKAVTKAPLTAPKPLNRSVGARPRFAYILFAVTMLPLALQMMRTEANVLERIQSMVNENPELAAQLEAATSDDEFFTALPEGRVSGAHLPHETWMHWIYAAIAAAAFLGIIRLLFEPGNSTILNLLLVGAVTSTVGIISLIAFQWIAAFSQGFWMHGRSILVVLFYIVKFIGFSYQAADDPANGFLLSFLGFTAGVGLCEEITKAFVIFAWLGSDHKLDWRGACALGLASGVGFGVAEGIMYSSDYYNGLATGHIYFTRFISCVALHAAWTGAVGVLAAQNQAGLNSEGSDWIFNMLLIIGVPVVLHGLYDTLLKRDMNMIALAVAAASFAWLIILIERARSTDEIVPQSRRMASAFA